MKKGIILVLILIGLLIIANISYLNYLASADDYPEDNFLLSEKNKSALIIVAHDDDAISMSATISLLTDNGWSVSELCFYQGWKDKDVTRKRDLKRAAKLLGMNPPLHYDLNLRKNRDQVKEPWMPIPYNQFDEAYNKEAVLEHLSDFIQKNNPSVIFTLDNIIGGYGHPDHVFMSNLVIDYCKESLNDPSFTVKKIYQAVYDPGMNEKILKDMPVFQSAKSTYGVNQSPKPDIYIPLDGKEEIKKSALLEYTTEQNALTKVWPYYSLYPSSIYFGIFDKEYYRVLERKNNFDHQ